MRLTRKRWIATALVCAAVVPQALEARAQSADAGYPGGSGGTIANPFGSISPVGPLGGSFTGAGGGPMMGTGMQNSLFSSPYAAPALYGAMTNLTTPGTPTTAASQAQTMGNLGLMMLLANSQGANRGGAASPNPGANANASRAMTANSRVNSKTRGRAQPAGLATRYFNRTQHNTPYPRTFYNRQSRYYP